MAELEIPESPLESADALAVTKRTQAGAAVPEEEEMERAAATKARKLFNKRAPIYDFLFRKMILFLSGRTPLMRFFLGWLWRSNLYTKSELDVVLEKAGATDVEYLPFPVGNPYLTRGGYMLVVQIARPLE